MSYKRQYYLFRMRKTSADDRVMFKFNIHLTSCWQSFVELACYHLPTDPALSITDCQRIERIRYIEIYYSHNTILFLYRPRNWKNTDASMNVFVKRSSCVKNRLELSAPKKNTRRLVRLVNPADHPLEPILLPEWAEWGVWEAWAEWVAWEVCLTLVLY